MASGPPRAFERGSDEEVPQKRAQNEYGEEVATYLVGKTTPWPGFAFLCRADRRAGVGAGDSETGLRGQVVKIRIVLDEVSL